VVCAQTDAEAGNRALVERGGTPIDPTAIPVDESFEEWVRANGQRASDSEEDDDGSTTERASSVDSEKVQSSLEKFE
jgi:hypothetical protein